MSKILQKLKSKKGYSFPEAIAFVIIVMFFFFIFKAIYYEGEDDKQEQKIHFKKHRPVQPIVEITE